MRDEPAGHGGVTVLSARHPAARHPVVRRHGRWLPAALIAAAVAVDLSLPPAYMPSALFAAAPLVAAPLFSAGRTLLCGLAALLTLVVTLVVVGGPKPSEAALRVSTVAVMSVLALGVNFVVRRSERLLASARDIATVAQQAVLPAPPARVATLDVAARYEAAQADARIGGDLYAVQGTPFGVRLLVGDVRGKGLGAVDAVAVVLGAFREAAEQEPELVAVAARLDRALQREKARRQDLDTFEGFTTAALAEVPTGRPGLLRVVNRGHPPPLLFHGTGSTYLEPSVPTLPLGLSELGVWPDRVDEWPFPASAQLLLYTDGLSEARDPMGRFYDPARGMAGRDVSGPEALLDALVADVARWSRGRWADDMALLAVRRGAGTDVGPGAAVTPEGATWN